MQEKPKDDECFILIKAQPHRSSKYFETVCCAGIGRDGRWRRQYPVPYRILQDTQKFRRWDWISYRFTRSEDDRRHESQKVIPETIDSIGKLKKSERARFINPLVRDSFEDADRRRESLTILRPTSVKIISEEKSKEEISDEAEKHAALANQLSFFDSSAKPLKPCPVLFKVRWKDGTGKIITHECDDWETSNAFNRFERDYGREKGISIIREKYEEEYFESGLVLGFSTHKRRNIEHGALNQWLLVGIIRLDYDSQGDFLMI